MAFDGLRKIALAIEVVAWLTLALGVVLGFRSIGSTTLAAELMVAGSVSGGALLLILAAQVGRAVAFIAEMAQAERDALPLPGGGRAPGVLHDVRLGKELRRLSDGRYWVEGEVARDLVEVRKLLGEDEINWR